MAGTILRWTNKETYRKMIGHKHKVERYQGHLSAKEVQLNDILRKLINSVKGFKDAETVINKSSIKNIGGFMNNVKRLYPKVYSSRHFRNYSRQIVKLEKEITHERIMVNRFISRYNYEIDKSPILARAWKFEKMKIIKWSTGRNVDDASSEYNSSNKDLKF
jgi:hypothetical protein